MNKVYHYIQNYLVYGFLPVVALIVWSYFMGANVAAESPVFVKFIHEILCYNTMLWFAMLTIFMISIVIVPTVREKALRRLANLQERDEREEYITGKAARASYVATLSLTLLLLFFSMFNFSYAKLEHTLPGKPAHNVAIGFGYHLFAETTPAKPGNQGVITVLDTSSYALSASTLLMILLGWQLIIFNLSARKL